MNIRLFNTIIILAFVALLGVVVMQVYWVRNAIELKEEQFDNSVRIAMKSVLNRLLEDHTDSAIKQLNSTHPCVNEKKEVADVISPKVLDSLISAEMQCMRVGDAYEYMIYNRSNHRLVMGNARLFVDELFISEHQQSIEALFSPGDYYFSMYFPRKSQQVIFQLSVWMLLSALFLLAVIIGFWYTVNTVIKQKKISEMKNDFINNLTHEFKTPMATINLASEMLSKPMVLQNQDKAQSYARVIHHENERLQHQVEQILQIALLDRNEIQLQPNHFDICELLADLIEGFNIRAEDVGGKITLKSPGNEVYIKGDRLHLAQLFSNLIDNALKYNDKIPQIQIEVSMEEENVRVAVIDNGIGISATDIGLIFKNFYRVHTGNIHDVKGFGIGLYYVEKVAKLHGGKVQVESELDKGSTFVVQLPVVGKNAKQ
ncbi:MAG: HAMP domain-containing sensor histidine kinase [Bacteroidales bacterium]|jgi:two-component system phosphate regulon sensor histidine kinase PhoR|nr:HAMP domain-containing sensor histidine kinase [Bacteroidales bacterium]MDY0086795.1 HAMP domain-containing sensor histidine kinase [Bacteroidales bacterium]